MKVITDITVYLDELEEDVKENDVSFDARNLLLK